MTTEEKTTAAPPAPTGENPEFAQPEYRTDIRLDADEDPGDRMILNMGPQHPSTHGVLRIVLEVDGERVVRAIPDVGYLHRGKEKIGESLGYHRYIPYTDRLDYLAPLANNCSATWAFEKICGIEAPPRAQAIRTICCELARISAHLLGLGAYGMDVGAMTVFLYTFTERETLYNFFEHLTGARFTTTYTRIGGVSRDADDEWLRAVHQFVSGFDEKVDTWENLLTNNRIWRIRNEGIGVITRQMALDYGLTGPVLRASGVAYDVRKDRPYGLYDQVDFDVPVGQHGDCYDRYLVRIEEMRQSARIVKQIIDKMPDGPVLADEPKYVLPDKQGVMTGMEELIHQFMLITGEMDTPKGEVHSHTELPKGEGGYIIRSEGGAAPWRLKYRAPSFVNLQVLKDILPGVLLADIVAILGSIDFVMGECDK
ncbi:MAG: NADH dehydrogenase (quinone) subunit D [Planctomycetota bacterium]|nr:NADH dehydrogenase (quinone) subunit D [Planctomycetota bacterium]